MPYHDYHIHDNVHGSIGLSDVEFRIVNTLAFQRLRRIKHLGLASLVFPGADHTRFSHSLGVLHIMGRMTNTLERKQLLNPEDTKKLRMAALLHDIGHYPLSHVIESVYKKRRREIVQSKATANLGKLSEVMQTASANKEYWHHEKLGEIVITKRDEIKNILENAEIDPKEIATIINAEHKNDPIYSQLMHSGLDADRIDYLMRDSALTGVSYGKIDLDYLLNHLDCKDGIVGIHYKGQHTVEHFLIARFFMYSQITFHKTIMSFEAIAKALFDILADENIVHKDFEKIKAIVNTDEFLDFNDNYFHSKIIEGFKKHNNFKGKNRVIYEKYYRTLNERKPLKLIREEKTLIERNTTKQGQVFSNFVQGNKYKLDDVLKNIGKETDDALFFETSIQIEGTSPYYLVSLVKTNKDIEDEKGLIKIIKKDGSVKPLIEDNDSLIFNLNKFNLKIARLYLRLDNNTDESNLRLKEVAQTW